MGKITDFLKSKAHEIIFDNVDESTLRVMAETKSGSTGGGENPISGPINNDVSPMQAQNLKNWKNALLFTRDKESLDFSALHDLYEKLNTDGYLISTVEKRIEPIQSA